MGLEIRKVNNLPMTLFDRSYSLEPKSVTAFDLSTFFHTNLIQSEASWKWPSTSDWLTSA